jgi:hypothetical protein
VLKSVENAGSDPGMVNEIVWGQLKHHAEEAAPYVYHHEGYIPWSVYERNQRQIRENARMRGCMTRTLNRKNALFYKTQNGARVGDLYMRAMRGQRVRLLD